ncbi:hypothetical protein L228DRAFT_248861 [Xylona heveae TC161]|uniref:assimilatory sulfite reductase (NADPH) n=1 Tax=Xylona heveae (strain CBS 132557 / TC161) TaxID=1328760 RepID=A0A165FL00_XYLHT|nr:hypothetical protein L228DRAFT_248861 [Xylona heveae TC161]KZF21098.1 hypothetical protein L228DRAFT_248861 [Xylona heveae TC161]
MRFQTAESSGPAGPEALQNGYDKRSPSPEPSTSLPFGQGLALSAIRGPTYLTAQTLIQQVAYTLSDKLFTYSPETFDLDLAVKDWSAQDELNAHGYTTKVSAMETRLGAGAIALGYMFSKDFDLKKRHIPQGILASSSTLTFLRSALDQLSLLYSVANPFVAHIAAVDYAAGTTNGLVTDYALALDLAEDLGFGLVSSTSAYESQHMALFATLLASILPTIHVYDGIRVGRETTRIVDALDQSALSSSYNTVRAEADKVDKSEDAGRRTTELLKAFNDELGTAYKLFEYHGHSEAEAVLVVFGSVEASLAAQVAAELAKRGAKIGVVNVRVYRPFVEEAFLAELPVSVRNIVVLGQVQDALSVAESTVHSKLYDDVLASIVFSAGKFAKQPEVVDLKYAREQVFTPSVFSTLFQQIASQAPLQLNTAAEEQADVDLLDQTSVQQYSFWDVDDSVSATAPVALGQLLSKDSSSNVFVRTGHDNLVQGGSVRTDIRSSKKAIEAPYAIANGDVAVVLDAKLFESFDIISSIKVGGSVLVRLPGVKDEDVEKKLPVGVRKALVEKKIEFFVLDPQASETVSKDETAESYLTQLAFLSVARKDLVSNASEKLAAVNGNPEALQSLDKELEKALRAFEVPEAWATVEAEVEIPSLPTDVNVNSFAGFDKSESEPVTLSRDWKTVAQGLAFKEAFDTKAALRPDLPVKTYTIKVKENKRLTPTSYDRNIFHIEFDLGDSGLKYDIGEALGIHAHNDTEEVNDFITFYGLNPEEVVQVPSREDPDVLESRTIFQGLQQNVDLWGRPPKRFYQALSEFATDEKEKRELLALGGAEGATEFKRRAEVDTVTYADILLEFPSAHPSFDDIVRIVDPMKRREYSISSSQIVNPTTVSLLIVVVSWVDPHGRDRWGQATRYLHRLRPGDSLTASVKPSVMKLPPKSTQPLIMAGLGTGLAPFRAFVQYRAWQKSQGLPIGAVLLYMGSRTQREEYLYGEEWEAYRDSGIVTLLGRAFSRDQPQKIYIQDRMRETLPDIIQAYIREEGAFYLCGPTWPVPDVTSVLEEAITTETRARANDPAKKVDARREIENLKEEERYILEVY